MNIMDEIEKIRNLHISKDKQGYEYVVDNESFHICWDNLLIKILRKLEYDEVADLYEEDSKKYFWYS